MAWLGAHGGFERAAALALVHRFVPEMVPVRAGEARDVPRVCVEGQPDLEIDHK